jgi:hypothetical protein
MHHHEDYGDAPVTGDAGEMFPTGTKGLPAATPPVTVYLRNEGPRRGRKRATRTAVATTTRKITTSASGGRT